MLVDRADGSLEHMGKPKVEAFVKHGGRVVYLVRQGVTLQATLKGPGIFDYALATVIWHEMAHIDGADETAAQQAEEQLGCNSFWLSAWTGTQVCGTSRCGKSGVERLQPSSTRF